MPTLVEIVKRQPTIANINVQSTSVNSLNISIFSTSAPRLDALTSLRFFAAASIVFLHSAAFFLDVTFLRNWQLEQGVTFFSSYRALSLLTSTLTCGAQII